MRVLQTVRRIITENVLLLSRVHDGIDWRWRAAAAVALAAGHSKAGDWWNTSLYLYNLRRRPRGGEIIRARTFNTRSTVVALGRSLVAVLLSFSSSPGVNERCRFTRPRRVRLFLKVFRVVRFAHCTRRVSISGMQNELAHVYLKHGNFDEPQSSV